MSTPLHLLMNGEHLGSLDGQGKRVRLLYDRDLNPDEVVPLSVSMPLSHPRHRGPLLTNWLTGLLPDRDSALVRWRAEFGITDLHPESLLAHIGEDVAGACQFVREDRLDIVLANEGSVTALDSTEIASIARAARQDSLPFDAQTSTGRFSLAGAQVKFALQSIGEDRWALPAGGEPSTHIFKPAIPDLEDQDVTEVVSMRTAAKLGLPTAHTFIAEFDGQRVIAVERYDRQFLDGKWWRVHQEDLCQAAGIDPRLKYESQGGPGISACGRIIRRHCGEKDVRAFARAVIYNYLIKGSDAHARNYSMLITPGDLRLAPLYDLNSTLSFGTRVEAQTLAMAVGGEERFDSISLGNWRLFATELQLPEDWVVQQLRETAERLPDAITEVCASPDLGGLADATLSRLTKRVAEWTEVAGQRPHSIGSVRATILERQKLELEASLKVYQNAQFDLSCKTLTAALTNAMNDGIIDEDGVRTPIWETNLHYRFKVGPEAPLVVNLERDDGTVLSTHQWVSEKGPTEFLQELVFAVMEAGGDLGTGLNDPTESLEQLTDMLVEVTTLRAQELAGYRDTLHHVIERRDGWYFTRDSILPKENLHYRIAVDRLNELDWEDHLRGKGWYDAGSALEFARKLYGEKVRVSTEVPDEAPLDEVMSEANGVDPL